MATGADARAESPSAARRAWARSAGSASPSSIRPPIHDSGAPPVAARTVPSRASTRSHSRSTAESVQETAADDPEEFLKKRPALLSEFLGRFRPVFTLRFLS